MKTLRSENEKLKTEKDAAEKYAANLFAANYKLRVEWQEFVEALRKVCRSLPYSGALGADIKSLLDKLNIEL